MYYIYREHKDKAGKIVVGCMNTEKGRLYMSMAALNCAGKMLLGPLPDSVLYVYAKYVPD